MGMRTEIAFGCRVLVLDEHVLGLDVTVGHVVLVQVQETETLLETSMQLLLR